MTIGQELHYRPFNLRDFSEPDPMPAAEAMMEAAEVVPPEPSFNEEELQNAQKEAEAIGYAKGKADAEKAAQNEAAEREKQLVAAVESLTGRLDAETAALRGRLQAQQMDVAKLITLAVEKLTGTALQKHPLGPVEPMVAECLAMLAGEEQLLIRVSKELVEPLRSHLDGKGDLKGKIDVVEGSGMQIGDCRLEWADGSAERNQQAMWEEIERVVTRNYAP